MKSKTFYLNSRAKNRALTTNHSRRGAAHCPLVHYVHPSPNHPFGKLRAFDRPNHEGLQLFQPLHMV